MQNNSVNPFQNDMTQTKTPISNKSIQLNTINQDQSDQKFRKDFTVSDPKLDLDYTSSSDSDQEIQDVDKNSTVSEEAYQKQQKKKLAKQHKQELMRQQYQKCMTNRSLSLHSKKIELASSLSMINSPPIKRKMPKDLPETSIHMYCLSSTIQHKFQKAQLMFYREILDIQTEKKLKQDKIEKYGYE